MKSFATQTHYEVLEISVGASATEVRSAFERLSNLYAEDQIALYGLVDPATGAALHQRLKEAFEVLSDESRRDAYDAKIGLPPRVGAPKPRPAPVTPRPSPVAAWSGSYTFVSSAPAPSQPAPQAYTWVVPAPTVERSAPPVEPESQAPQLPLPLPSAPVVVTIEPRASAPPPAPVPSISITVEAPRLSPPAPAPAPSTPVVVEAPRMSPPAPALSIPIVVELSDPAPAPAPVEPPRMSPPVAPAAVEPPRHSPPVVEAPIAAEPPPAPEPEVPVFAPINEESAITITRAKEYRAEPRPKPYEIPEGVEINGDLLRQVRMARGITLAQLSDRMRVSVRHLENVEGDRYGQLPVGVYLRGILMNLARELGLDGVRVSRSYLTFVDANRSKG